MPIQHRQGTFLRMDGDNYIFDVDGTEMSFTRDQIINITRPIGSQNSSFLSQPSVSTLPPPPKRARVGGVVIPPPGEGNNIQPDEMFAPGALNESSGSSGNSSSGGIDVSDIEVGDQAYLPFNIGAGGRSVALSFVKFIRSAKGCLVRTLLIFVTANFNAIILSTNMLWRGLKLIPYFCLADSFVSGTLLPLMSVPTKLSIHLFSNCWVGTLPATDSVNS